MEKQSKVKSWQVAEIELVYKSKVKRSQLQKITSSKVCYETFLSYWNHDRIQHIEQCKMLLLNQANKVIGMHELSTGGITSTAVDPRVIFTGALLVGATAIIIAHNHPSGNLQPSEMDKQLTNKLRAAGELLDITVLDHLIITDEGYLSFADEGLLQ